MGQPIRLVAAFANEISATTEQAITALGNMLVKTLSTNLDQKGHLGQLPIASTHLRHVTNMALSANASIAVWLGTLFGQHLRDIADYEGARDVLQRVLAVSSLTDDPEELASAWIGLARVQRSLGQDRESLNSAERAERLLRTADSSSPEMMAHVLQRKGWSLFMLGRAAEAIAAAEEGLFLRRKANSSQEIISNLNLLCEVHANLIEQYEIAVQYNREALAIARNIENLRAEAALLSNLGELVKCQGDYEKAFDLYQKAINLSNETGYKDKEIDYRANLGRAQVLLGVPVRSDRNQDVAYDSRACFKQSLEVLSKSQSQWGRALVLWYWAEAELLQGDKELGEKMWREARDIFTRLNLPLMVARMEADTNKQ
jgi:tetratricopeptide (TPR) repeat protein